MEKLDLEVILSMFDDARRRQRQDRTVALVSLAALAVILALVMFR